MSNSTFNHIPSLQPAQFDEWLFDGWKPQVGALFEKFHIERIENYKQFLELPVLPHRRSVYFLIFVSQGHVLRSKGLERYRVNAGELFCLPSNHITSVEHISADLKGFYCHFKPEFFHSPQLHVTVERDFPFFRFSNAPIVKLSDFRSVSHLFESLYQESQAEQQRPGIIALKLLLLLNEIKLSGTLEAAPLLSSSHALAEKYKLLIFDKVYTYKTVREFADDLEVSPNHLNKCVKQSLGLSAQQLLQNIRILEAKVLLKQSDLSIAEIAHKLGAYEPSDFSRMFKRGAGISPKAYRQQIK